MLFVGFDGGYGYTKAAASNGKEIIIPSLVGEGFEMISGELVNYNNRLDHQNIQMEIEGTKYFVGELARLQSLNCSYAFDGNKIRHLNTKILLATTVAMLMEHDYQDITLVAGLPFSDFVSQKRELQSYLNNFNVQVRLFDNKNVIERTVNFHTALPFSQVVAAIFQLGEHYSYDGVNLIGYIDVGTKTTDFVVFSPDNMVLIEKISGTINVGAHMLHSYLTPEIERLTGAKPGTPELEQVMRKGFIFKDGQRHDLTKVINDGKSNLARQIKDEINRRWSSRYGDLGMVFLVGGGAELLKDHAQEIYKGVIIPDQPTMMNAKGFLIVAKQLANPVYTVD